MACLALEILCQRYPSWPTEVAVPDHGLVDAWDPLVAFDARVRRAALRGGSLAWTRLATTVNVAEMGPDPAEEV